ncbi:MAG: hypothetical protein QM698_11665 [Micropepsaceae bacterium]
MNDKADDDIDALLRAAFEGPVPPGDFCDRVMARLPVRRRRFPWTVAAGLAAGVAFCGWSLGAAPLARTGWRDWFSGDLTAPAVILMLAAAGFAVLASVWTMTEATER